jgi:hypothetical protein
VAKENPFDKLKKIDVSIYGMVIYLTSSKKQFSECVKWVNVEKKRLYCGCSMHIENQKGHSFILIGVFNNELSTLVHECSHASFQILKWAEVDANEGSNEAFCYLNGYIFDQAMKLGVING